MEQKNSLILDAAASIPIDCGRRRLLSWTMDFDARSTTLATEIKEDWEEAVKEQWRENKKHVTARLAEQYGQENLQDKVRNFTDLGNLPFSIIAHHNHFHRQARDAFVVGAYFPALASACALGERLLNHLVLDMRDDFKATPEYRRVYRKQSFDNWRLAIDTLVAWGILLPNVAICFAALEPLRNRSLHFNPTTYNSVRQDALAALLHLRTIIGEQFGTIGQQPWLIEGTSGNFFVKKSFENHPFVRKYFAPVCPYVGPLFSINFGENFQPIFADYEDYGAEPWTDEEYRNQFNNRDPSSLAAINPVHQKSADSGH